MIDRLEKTNNYFAAQRKASQYFHEIGTKECITDQAIGFIIKYGSHSAYRSGTILIRNFLIVKTTSEIDIKILNFQTNASGLQ